VSRQRTYEACSGLGALPLSRPKSHESIEIVPVFSGDFPAACTSARMSWPGDRVGSARGAGSLHDQKKESLVAFAICARACGLNLSALRALRSLHRPACSCNRPLENLNLVDFFCTKGLAHILDNPIAPAPIRHPSEGRPSVALSVCVRVCGPTVMLGWGCCVLWLVCGGWVGVVCWRVDMVVRASTPVLLLCVAIFGLWC